MLSDSRVTANIPAADIGRAKAFYSEVLGFEPAQDLGGMVVYRAGDTLFSVYQTEHAGQAGHTLAQFHVTDIQTEAKELRARGVVFEQYDLPGTTWTDGIAYHEGMGYAAWFTDSEGNVLCIDQPAAGLALD
ncbi:putative enzyme related to lactoylglutathione lyase [Motilibacter rhizosphaerae]|uniref:Putative enzyme related to lactoylglutathione lyase n=1 Tax=Motilibacter rhizosphaerae TaxID=598652 RepID=A0A4V2F4H9_9ACTN|nr:VOC family protein [Motilibacter rhizosphaerae]RZS89379.1 putative enzyme related to lactoylglutathione lyase [Motilibacter rhizosphaerae]